MKCHQASLMLFISDKIIQSIRGVSLLALLVVFDLCAQSQATFSKLFYYDLSNVANQVWETESGYAVLGGKIDTTSNGDFYSTLFVSDWDSLGNQNSYFKIGNSLEYFYADWNVNVENARHEHYVFTSALRDSILCGFIMLFDNDLDTAWTKRFYSPIYLESQAEYTDWLIPTCADINFEGQLFASCQIYQPITENDFCIFKFDSLGNELWHYVYSGEHESDLCFTLKSTLDGGVIACAGGVNSGNTINHNDEVYFKLDSLGNMDWQYFGRNEFDGNLPRDMILEEDGIVMVTTIYDGIDYNDPLIYKMDYQNNLLWYGQRTGLSWGARLVHLTQNCQGNYVSAGKFQFNNPENTLTPFADEMAYIIQFDTLGNVIWDRWYSIVDSPYDFHNIYDFKATRDGGYVMVGEGIDAYSGDGWIAQSPRQRAWILKVDGCGCLVPGCDSLCSPPDCSPESIDTTTHYQTAPGYFIYGPNPISETLNIYIGENFPVGSEFVLYDAQGRLIKSFVPQRADAAYVWGMQELAAGTYQLLLRSSDGILQVEQLIKLSEP